MRLVGNTVAVVPVDRCPRPILIEIKIFSDSPEGFSFIASLNIPLIMAGETRTDFGFFFKKKN